MFRHRKGHAIVSTTTLQLTITNLSIGVDHIHGKLDDAFC